MAGMDYLIFWRFQQTDSSVNIPVLIGLIALFGALIISLLSCCGAGKNLAV